MKRLRILGAIAFLFMAVSTLVMGNHVTTAQAHVAQASSRNADNTKNKQNTQNANTRNERRTKKATNARNKKNKAKREDLRNIRNKKFMTSTLKLITRSDNTATFKVGKQNNTHTYEIYRSNSSNGEYTLVGTTQNGEFVDTSLSANSSYYYKSKVQNNDNDIIRTYSDIIFVGQNLESPKNVEAVSSDDSVKLNWTKVSKASKYKIYRSTSQNGDYAKVGTSKDNHFVDNSVDDNSTYYYKVKAIATLQKAIYTSPFSNSVSITTLKNTDNGNSHFNKEYAAEVLQLINTERKKEGLSTLNTTNALTDAANLRASELKDLFSHTRPDGTNSFTALDKYNVSYRTAGENIAYGQKTPEAVVDAWMNSTGHRANILSNNFGKVGIGCYVASDGTLYWTQLFTD